MPFWLTALLGFAIVARVTRFLNSDYLFAPARDWLERATWSPSRGEGGKLYYLITCPWCASIWIAAPVAALAVWTLSPYDGWPAVWLFGGLWLGYSWLYGLAASTLDGDD